MQLYKVKLKQGHKAKPDQMCGEYLGYGDIICLYTYREAQKKAIAFGGIFEPHGKNYTVNNVKVLQLAKQELSPAVLRELREREVYTDPADETNEPIYYGDVFATILGEENEMDKLLQRHSASLIDELLVLDKVCANYEYVMIL